jgi:hypothetical protein
MWTTKGILSHCKEAIGAYDGLCAYEHGFFNEAVFASAYARKERLKAVIRFIGRNEMPPAEAMIHLYDFCLSQKASSRLVIKIWRVLLAAAGIRQLTYFEHIYANHRRDAKYAAALHHYVQELREGLGQTGEWEDRSKNVMLDTLRIR